VDFASLVMSALSAVIGILMAGVIIHSRQAKADRDAAAGRPVVVAASIRLASRGRHGRMWRSGTINLHKGRMVWTPNTPWGRSIDLTGAGYTDRRRPAGALRWLLPPASIVVSCLHAARAYELALLPGSIKHLYRAQFA
jgi:hypothetical protein